MPPHPTLGQHYRADHERAAFIGALFDSSARHYDRVSAVMSLGTDKYYRRRALMDAGLAPGMAVLDVACGTGMVAEPAAEIVGPSGSVVGLDPSAGMLRQALERRRLSLAVQGRAETLPFDDGAFDFLSMGFALRHVADLRVTFGEYRRVLKPGGRLLILEITPPESRAAFRLFQLYLKSVVPIMTRLSTGNRDAQSLMSYFWDTVEQCVPPATITDALSEVGFAGAERRISAGVFSEYQATKT